MNLLKYLLLQFIIFGHFYIEASIPTWKKEFLPEGNDWKKTKQHLKINIDAEPETLDPALMTGVTEFRMAINLFEGLVSYDPKTLEARPGVAKSWKVSNQSMHYTFQLRKDAKWNDGSPITAKDFVYSWKRALTPKTAASYAYLFFPILGAEDFHTGKLKDFSKVGIKATSDHILEVVLHQPCLYFLDLAAFPTFYPIPKHIIAKHHDRWTKPEHFIGNGPFKLNQWKTRQYLTLEKNAHYWDHKSVYLERVTAYFYDDLETAYKLYLQGKLHWLPSLPINKIQEAMYHSDYYVMPYMGSYFYRFNTQHVALKDKRVRKALSISIDRDIITKKILQSGEESAQYFCPPVGDYQHVQGIDYNPELARKLLQEAGYGPKGKAFPILEILYNTRDSHKKIAESIAEQWKKELNINIKLRNTEWKIFLKEMDQLQFDICRSSWIGDYGDPSTFFDLFQSKGGNNRTGWSHKEYDDLLIQSQKELDSKKRLKLFKLMERILVEDEFPIMPLYIYVNKGLLSEQVNGWYENIRDTHPLKYIWLEP